MAVVSRLPLQARANNLLDPKTGIMRGLTKGDRGDKPLSITIAEAREVEVVISSLAAIAFGNRQADAPNPDAARPALAQAYVDGLGSQMLELQEDCIALRRLLVTAAKQFRFYEEQHRAKKTPDADAKAEVNRAMAQKLEDAIGGNPHVEVAALLKRVVDETWKMALNNNTPPTLLHETIIRKAMEK